MKNDITLTANDAPKSITDIILKKAKFYDLSGNFSILFFEKDYGDFTDVQFGLCDENDDILMIYSDESKTVQTCFPSYYKH